MMGDRFFSVRIIFSWNYSHVPNPITNWHLARKSGVLSSIPGLATSFISPSAFSRRAAVSCWRKYVHEVLVNRLGGLSLPRKSVVRLTDHPDMTLDVYRGRETTMQQQQQSNNIFPGFSVNFYRKESAPIGADSFL